MPYSFSVSNDPCANNPGNTAARFEAHMDEERTVQCMSGRTEPIHRRTEMMPNDRDTRPGYKEDFWAGERIYIPTTWPDKMPFHAFTLMQIIPIVDGSAPGTDFKLFLTRDNHWVVEIRTGWDSHESFDLGPITKGGWTDFTLRYKRSTGGDGVAQLWMNGKPVVDYHGQTTHTARSDRVDWKTGLYAGTNDPHNKNIYTMWIDDVKIAKGENQYHTVAPCRPR